MATPRVSESVLTAGGLCIDGEGQEQRSNPNQASRDVRQRGKTKSSTGSHFHLCVLMWHFDCGSCGRTAMDDGIRKSRKPHKPGLSTLTRAHSSPSPVRNPKQAARQPSHSRAKAVPSPAIHSPIKRGRHLLPGPSLFSSRHRFGGPLFWHISDGAALATIIGYIGSEMVGAEVFERLIGRGRFNGKKEGGAHSHRMSRSPWRSGRFRR